MIGNQRYVTIYFTSIANLKCTPSGRQMDPQGYMYPRLGTSVINHALQIFACGSLSFSKNYIFVFYFLLLLQSVEILQNGTVVASMPYSVTFASGS